MPDTDRKKIKDQQKGVYVTTAGIATVDESVNDLHKRTYSTRPPYAANDAATWVGLPICTHPRKCKARSFRITPTTVITGNATNYQLFTLAWRHANGDAGATLGTWNTHTGAQSTIAANAGVSMTLVTNSDAEIAANAHVKLTMAPQGTGWNVDQLTEFTFDVEEI